jgi:hypothetical protein
VKVPTVDDPREALEIGPFSVLLFSYLWHDYFLKGALNW